VLPADYASRLQALEATGALCVVLETDRPLTPYYWLNVADREFPFGGVIEHTNLVAAARYADRHVVYLSKYLFPDHPLWRAAEGEVWRQYAPFLRRLNPDFEESWVLARHNFKASFAQPVVPCHYSRLVPPLHTPVAGLLHACMAQVYPEDRGQNFAVREANRAAEALLQEG
jgi:protoporphyrinogen oxidase